MKKMITLPPFDNNYYVWKGNNWERIDIYSDLNLAAPDLTGKEYLGDGVYRLDFNAGVTFDYNVYNGNFIVNGTPTDNVVRLWNVFNIPVDTYSFSFYKVSGTSDVNALYYNGESIEQIIVGNIRNNDIIYNNNVLINSKIITLVFSDYTKTTYDNYQFKLQLEKGTTATPYKPPAAPVKYWLEHDAEPKALLMQTLTVMDDNNLEKKVYTNLKQIKEKI